MTDLADAVVAGVLLLRSCKPKVVLPHGLVSLPLRADALFTATSVKFPGSAASTFF